MRRLRETNRIGPKERGGGESALAFLALKNVDSVEVICKGEHRPCPSADDLPEDIPRHLLPRETPKDSHAESHLYNVLRRGRIFQGEWHTTGFTWPPETPPATQAPRETPVPRFFITCDRRQELTNCKPIRWPGKDILPLGKRQHQYSYLAQPGSYQQYL